MYPIHVSRERSQMTAITSALQQNLRLLITSAASVPFGELRPLGKDFESLSARWLSQLN
jgi:hypothetical protein